MGTRGGTGTVNEGLVFGYDTGRNPSSGFDHRNYKRRFNKGKNTANIVTNTNLDTGWSKGYNTSIQTNDYPPPRGIDSQVYSFIDVDGNENGYWYSYGDYAPQDPSTTYTISLWVRTIGSNFALRAYTANNSETGRQFTNTTTILGDGKWHRAVFNSITTPSNTQSDSLSFQFTTFPANQRVWICAPQMEVGSVATPFVNGTRSSTQSLLDFKGSTDINVSNVSFDSNGLPTFDGTNDRITIPADSFPTIGTNNFTIEVISKNTKTSSYNHFFAVENQNHFALKMQNATNTDRNIYVYRTSTLSTFNAITARATSTTSYYHIVCRRDGDNIEIFLNGISGGTKSGWDNISIDNNTKTSYIGWGNGTEYTGGDIPVLKIYDRALSAQEIQQNYNAYKNRFNI